MIRYHSDGGGVGGGWGAGHFKSDVEGQRCGRISHVDWTIFVEVICVSSFTWTEVLNGFYSINDWKALIFLE